MADEIKQLKTKFTGVELKSFTRNGDGLTASFSCNLTAALIKLMSWGELRDHEKSVKLEGSLAAQTVTLNGSETLSSFEVSIEAQSLGDFEGIRRELEGKRKRASGMSYTSSERAIQSVITEWLAWDGWRCVVTDPAHLRGLGVSEPGIPDRQFIRYNPLGACEYCPPRPRKCFNCLSQASVLWVECKRLARYSKKERCWLPTKASQKQREWHQRERALGALVWVAGEDFGATIEGFCEHYAKSGLQRKKLSIPS